MYLSWEAGHVKWYIRGNNTHGPSKSSPEVPIGRSEGRDVAHSSEYIVERKCALKRKNDKESSGFRAKSNFSRDLAYWRSQDITTVDQRKWESERFEIPFGSNITSSLSPKWTWSCMAMIDVRSKFHYGNVSVSKILRGCAGWPSDTFMCSMFVSTEICSIYVQFKIDSAKSTCVTGYERRRE